MSEKSETPKTKRETLKEALSDSLFVRQEWQGRNIDPLLQRVVNQTNNFPSNEHLLTLTIGGNLVSGVLISGNAYMTLWAEAFSSEFTNVDGVADSIREDLLSWMAGPEDPENLLSAQFIHLKEAEIYSSNGRPILSGGSLWRGKLTSVDGFNLGRIVFNG